MKLMSCQKNLLYVILFFTSIHIYLYIDIHLELYTVVPVMNGHRRDQANVSVHCGWPLIRGNLTLKCVGRGIDNLVVQGRWPLTTGVAQGRYYCNSFKHVRKFINDLDDSL